MSHSWSRSWPQPGAALGFLGAAGAAPPPIFTPAGKLCSGLHGDSGHDLSVCPAQPGPSEVAVPLGPTFTELLRLCGILLLTEESPLSPRLSVVVNNVLEVLDNFSNHNPFYHLC